MKNRFIILWMIVLVVSFSACKEIRKEAETTPTTNKELPTIEDSSIYALLIANEGEIVVEDYFNGKTKESLCNVQSLTKGLMSMLLGIAIDKGFIKSVDEPIWNYLADEYKELADESKKKISIKHLLNQTSGLSWKGYLEHEAWLNSEDPISFVLNKNMEAAPGQQYNYNSGATHLLSVIISRATNKSTLEFAREVLFDPLGIEAVDWEKRNKGYHDGSGLGLAMKPADLMKMGQLLANQGSWNGEQILPAEWVSKLFDEKEKMPTTWGIKNSKHGFCWYKSTLEGNTVDYGMGYGGQFMILIPDRKLIIVTTHNHDTPKGIEQQTKFLRKELPKLIKQY